MNRRRSHSVDKHSDDGSYPDDNNNTTTTTTNNNNNNKKPLAPAVLVYHESARSIVFRDHLRRAVQDNEDKNTKKKHMTPNPIVQTTTDEVKPGGGTPHVKGYIPTIAPLQSLQLGPNDNFQDLLQSVYDCTNTNTNHEYKNCSNKVDENNTTTTNSSSSSCSLDPLFSDAEQEVVEMLHQQRCCVKTIKNSDWAAFIDRFYFPQKRSSTQTLHDDIPPSTATNGDDPQDINTNEHRPFNSFVTSTTMLPSDGRRMRAFGSTTQYTIGVIFALPRVDDYDLYDYVGTADGSDVNTIDMAYNIAEETIAMQTETWSWPAGYSAKTEFNIDSRGKLINGRQEAIRSLTTLRRYNDDYCTKEQYIVANRLVSGLSQIPYNEVFLRVGGYGRLVRGIDVSTITTTTSTTSIQSNGIKINRSFAKGVGLPVALFVRTAKFGDLFTLLRTRARLINTWGEQHMKGIPLLMIDPDIGVRVLTETLQGQLWKIASNQLNPFQNTTIAHRTTISHTDDSAFQQKVEELIELDDTIQQMLTPEELVRIAGGFGATDASVATILQNVLKQDQQHNKSNVILQSSHPNNNSTTSTSSHTTKTANDNDEEFDHDNNPPPPVVEVVESHRLQDVVNEGLTAAVRSGDYHTSRQLLILYSLVASTNMEDDADKDDNECDEDDLDNEANFEGGKITTIANTTNGLDDTNGDDMNDGTTAPSKRVSMAVAAERRSSINNNDSYKQMERDMKLVQKEKQKSAEQKLSLTKQPLPRPPPPPPLDTDRLREATNSDGLLAVLGAAEVLKAMQTGAAQRRTLEAVSAVEEWVDYGEQSMAFRISSWYDQRAAQGDLQIATESNTNFMAFVSNKAISNRKLFAQQLRDAAIETDFTDVRFLHAVNSILQKMNSPCLRLELLQYILGLDNRYSVAHVQRSVELAATCLHMSQQAISTTVPTLPAPTGTTTTTTPLLHPQRKLLTLGKQSSKHSI